jgi:hypothetical protein
MTPGQLAEIPPRVLYGRNTEELREWLWERGLSMTLLELDQLRRSRNPERYHRGRSR